MAPNPTVEELQARIRELMHENNNLRQAAQSTDDLRKEHQKLKAHSEALNGLCWVLAEALGKVTPDQQEIELDPDELVAEVVGLLASPGVQRIAKERNRQKTEEGWTAEHDAEHTSGELASAASAYALAVADELHPQSQGDGNYGIHPPMMWPWDASWWKFDPSNRVRALEKAGALVAAQLDLELKA